MKPLTHQTPGVSRCAIGSYDDELLLQLRTRAKVIARRLGLIDVEAEDVAQNTLLALIQDCNVLSPNAWVATVALRGAQGVIRRRIRNTRLTERIQTEWELMLNRDNPWDLLPDLTQVLQSLGQLERDVFLSQELNLCTWAELSVETGLSIPTLKRRMNRTRRLIRRSHKIATKRGNVEPAHCI